MTKKTVAPILLLRGDDSVRVGESSFIVQAPKMLNRTKSLLCITLVHQKHKQLMHYTSVRVAMTSASYSLKNNLFQKKIINLQNDHPTKKTPLHTHPNQLRPSNRNWKTPSSFHHISFLFFALKLTD